MKARCWPSIAPMAMKALVLVLCAVFLFLTCLHFRSELSRLRNLIRTPVLRHLVYRPVLRSRFLVNWSRADILTQLAYLGLTIFCLYFRCRNLSSAGLRAANLSLIHMVLLFASPHLDPLSNTLGLRWRPVRRLHASVGVMASILLILHLVCIQVDSRPFPLDKPENKWGLVVSCSNTEPDLALTLHTNRLSCRQRRHWVHLLSFLSRSSRRSGTSCFCASIRA